MEVAAAAIGFCALVLNIIPLIGTSSSVSTMKSLSWYHTKDAFIDYVGVVASFGGEDFKILWGDDTCPYALGKDTCDACASGFAGAIALVAIAFAFNVIGLVTAVLAVKNKSTSTWRIGGAVSAFLTMVAGIIAIIIFSTTCGADIDKKVDDDLTYGPSWVLMLVVLLLKAIEIGVWMFASTSGSRVAVTH